MRPAPFKIRRNSSPGLPIGSGGVKPRSISLTRRWCSVSCGVSRIQVRYDVVMLPHYIDSSTCFANREWFRPKNKLRYLSTTTDQPLPAVPVRRARPDTSNGGQQCTFHQSVPLRKVPKRAVKSFSIACSGCNQLCPASGSQTQSWVCAATGHSPPVFSSLSVTPRKNHG